MDDVGAARVVGLREAVGMARLRHPQDLPVMEVGQGIDQPLTLGLRSWAALGYCTSLLYGIEAPHFRLIPSIS